MMIKSFVAPARAMYRHISTGALRPLNRDSIVSMRALAQAPPPWITTAIERIESCLRPRYRKRPRGSKAGRSRRRPYCAIQTTVPLERTPLTGRGINFGNLTVISPIEVVNGSRRHDPTTRVVNHSNLHQIDRLSSYFLPRRLSLSLWNARSVVEKLPEVSASILSNETDIFYSHGNMDPDRQAEDYSR